MNRFPQDTLSKEANDMKAIAKTQKSYNLSYKKKSSTADSYLPRGASRRISVCEGCRAVNMNKRWYAEGDVDVNALRNPEAAKSICPACLKMRDNFPGGIVTLKGNFVLPHKKELMRLIKNEEERARGLNPLERVMSVKEDGHGSLVISTTNEKLAQRLGRAVKKAFHGAVAYHWSHDNKLVRVDWERAA